MAARSSLSIKYFLKLLASKFGRHNWPAVRPRLKILAYHRVLARDDPQVELEQPAMWVTPETFEKNIVWLKEKFEIIRLRDWVSTSTRTFKNKNYCCITFDDGWLDNYQCALPILIKHNVPITLFCVSEMIESGLDFWPGRLASYVRQSVGTGRWPGCLDDLPWLNAVVLDDEAIKQRPLGQANMDKLIDGCKIYSDSDINQFLDIMFENERKDYVQPRRLLNTIEVRKMIETGLVDIGSHTKYHTRLTTLRTDTQLTDEILGSKLSLEARFGVTVDLFCYPNGHWTRPAIEMVEQYYLGGCVLRSGWNYQGQSLGDLKRFNMHEDIANEKVEFFSRMSGFI